jgi:hypothetical protein
MSKLFVSLFIVASLIIIVIGCDDSNAPFQSDNSAVTVDDLLDVSSKISTIHTFTAPSNLKTVTSDSKSLTFWPYSGENFSGQSQDPINLIFIGSADPREIMAGLMSLDGDRSAFGLPPVAPFNATWTDAIGDVQTGYGNPDGWVGGVIQLACGDYGPARFHLRMFRMGEWTVANAHFEVLIPGTTDHQVLSWELAENFILVDMIRSGLLGALPDTTEVINEIDFRSIPAQIYNLLPVELKVAIDGPLGSVAVDVPIKSDGRAVVFNLAGSVSAVEDYRVQDFVIDFDQVIPKPFCATSPYDYLYVTGPVHLYQSTKINGAGKYNINFEANGELTVVPIDPISGQPVGEPMKAIVKETHKGSLDDKSFSASSWLFQKLVPAADDDAGSMIRRLRVNSQGNNDYEEGGDCRSDINLHAGNN